LRLAWGEVGMYEGHNPKEKDDNFSSAGDQLVTLKKERETSLGLASSRGQPESSFLGHEHD